MCSVIGCGHAELPGRLLCKKPLMQLMFRCELTKSMRAELFILILRI